MWGPGRTKRYCDPFRRSRTLKSCRVNPDIGTAMTGTSSCLSSRSSRSPVGPPAANSAAASAPKRCRTRATLIPPPPGSYRTSSQRSLLNAVSCSTEPEMSTAGFGVSVTIRGGLIVPLTSRRILRRLDRFGTLHGAGHMVPENLNRRFGEVFRDHLHRRLYLDREMPAQFADRTRWCDQHKAIEFIMKAGMVQRIRKRDGKFLLFQLPVVAVRLDGVPNAVVRGAMTPARTIAFLRM